MRRIPLFATFLGLCAFITARAVAFMLHFTDMVISWRWIGDMPPLIGKQTAIRAHANVVKQRTRFSSRWFASTGFYSAAVPA